MYRSLVVPLDGSSVAEQALPLALSIARHAGAGITLVRVHVPYALMYSDSMSPGTFQVDQDAKQQERAYLDSVRERLMLESAASVSSVLLEYPIIAEALNNHLLTVRADLIVMTTHGRGPLSRFWLGSVADELIRRATTPILLVPSHGSPVVGDWALRHVLIPLDGSPLAEHILEPAVAIGALMHSRYTLLRIYGPGIGTAVLEGPYQPMVAEALKPTEEQLRAEATGYLKWVTERLASRGCNVETRVMQAHHAASAILETAQELGTDLIALETHGRRGLTRMLLGSVADKVLRGASVPVLIHRSATC